MTATSGKINELIKERAALQQEFDNLVEQGLILTDENGEKSDVWYKYQDKLDSLDEEIVNTKVDLMDLYDTINNIKITKILWDLDALTAKAGNMQDFMSLHTAQMIDETDEAYKNLIDNGMEQIKNLEEQNEIYREQQKGLDVLSEKYQDLESKIQNNISAILDMKTSQEQWNDSIIDLKIDGLEKYKDSLDKMNDQYERQKKLREAIEEMEKAQSQRTQRVFREGVGFVYQADEDALKDAQENLENVIKDELLAKIDDLINALEMQKGDYNIYDAEGNLIGTKYDIPQLGSLNDILEKYQKEIVPEPFSGLKNSLYDQIVSSISKSNQTNEFNFGDINLNEINDVDTLGRAIIDLLPNAILQASNKQ